MTAVAAKVAAKVVVEIADPDAARAMIEMIAAEIAVAEAVDRSAANEVVEGIETIEVKVEAVGRVPKKRMPPGKHSSRK